jgi:hypothetical protein
MGTVETTEVRQKSKLNARENSSQNRREQRNAPPFRWGIWLYDDLRLCRGVLDHMLAHFAIVLLLVG